MSFLLLRTQSVPLILKPSTGVNVTWWLQWHLQYIWHFLSQLLENTKVPPKSWYSIDWRMLEEGWRRAEFKDKQCISKELLMVIAHADSVEGASMRGTVLEDITPSPFFES